MKYLALIYSDEASWEAATEEERGRVYEAYHAFAEEGRAAGALLGGSELAAVRTATTVRVREGRTAVTDGPYAETKEALAGYFVLECSSMAEAVDWAAKIPGAERGAVEVRPIHESEDNSAARAARNEGVAS